MARRCSHCSNNGHNSRTCPNRGVKLFGVRLGDGIRKSVSMGNLSHYSGSNSDQVNNMGSPSDTPDHGDAAGGYASEDFVVESSSSRERKKGVAWTEEEHRMFLLGMQKLGKGDWQGIARNYVISRTPTQVASHAQKYFIRQSNNSRRKRRSSLFDIVADEAEAESNNPFPKSPSLDEECESMDSTISHEGDFSAQKLDGPQYCYPVMYPAYFSPLVPFTFPFWSGYGTEPTQKETHEILKPTPMHSKNPINVDELLGLSKLSLGKSISQTAPTPLSSKLHEEGSSRQSAFHPNSVTGNSSMNSNSSQQLE